MASSGQPANRKQRRAAAKNNGNSTGAAFQPTSELGPEGVEFLLKHPDRSGPKGKTLFQLAEERQAELDKLNPGRRKQKESNTPPGERPFNDEDPIGPLGNAVLYSFSLASLHLTLDVIVYSQYREDVIWSEIFQRAATVFPIFLICVYLLHTEISLRFPTLRNLFFLSVSVAAGCYMIFSGNTNGYFYVMKTAPPIGALWIWSVFEMSLPFALASVITVAGYIWWNGFSTF